MKQIIILFGIVSIPFSLLAQDTLPRPGSFDEGYFFVGQDDLLKFKSYVQADGYFPVNNSPGVSEFLIRRARFAATGFFQKKFRYMLNASFDKGKAALQEAFLESRHVSFAKVRIGQFKVPFSLTNLQSDAQLDFISRSFIVENFSPSYDIGAMVFGDEKSKHFNYAFGLFNGRDLNQPENNNSKYIIGRVEFAPFISSEQSALSKLYLGASVANGKQNDDMSQKAFETGTEIPVFTFNDSVFRDGETTIYGYDLAWYVKRFSAQAEYINYKGKHLKNNSAMLDLSSTGYHVAFTYLLSGEDKKRNDLVKPKQEFDPQKGAWGAFELALRYEKTILSDAALFANMAKGTDEITAFTGGINWYLNDDVKVILNYSKYMFRQKVLIENKPYQSSNNFICRVQYQF
ncbi:MAG: OprO/OprP family phosphate-selective porin [Chitinophagaceae bacterium]